MDIIDIAIAKSLSKPDIPQKEYFIISCSWDNVLQRWLTHTTPKKLQEALEQGKIPRVYLTSLETMVDVEIGYFNDIPYFFSGVTQDDTGKLCTLTANFSSEFDPYYVSINFIGNINPELVITTTLVEGSSDTYSTDATWGDVQSAYDLHKEIYFIIHSADDMFVGKLKANPINLQHNTQWTVDELTTDIMYTLGIGVQLGVAVRTGQGGDSEPVMVQTFTVIAE